MKTRHDGDCSIYVSLDNLNVPEAGVCTCGYGHQLRYTGDWSQMYSEELKGELERKSNASDKDIEWLFKTLKKQGNRKG